jgi:predicted dehydrogenase
MNQGIHAIDLLVWLVGPIKSIQARTALLAHKRIEVEDAAVATVRFASGALGVIQGTTAAFPGAAVRHEIMGTDGMICLEDDVATLWKFRSETPADKAAGKPAAGVGAAANWSNLSNDIFVRCIDNFARAVREGKSPLVTGEEHKKAVEVICAIYQSAQTGKPVKLPLKRFAPKR